MREQSQLNKKAWNYRAYEFWCNKYGEPREFAKRLLRDPTNNINSRYTDFFQDIKGSKVLNALGSNGRKAVPLCLLGAEVTIIDISEENKKYALELANHTNVKLRYEISDFITYHDDALNEYFDIVFCEGGILHYFDDLHVFFDKVSKYLRVGGMLILNDFHPFRKIISSSTGTDGDYFDEKLRNFPVAYENQFDEKEQEIFPKCSLKFYQLGEIVTAVGQNDMQITELRELPKPGDKKVPGEFTLIAKKL
ncbi:class I SAM-dependent methyltransferase [Veronia pacifica]|uniref:Methyltransferase type 11 domain-containing protein n=1 Tax=Veronia pacifica TaxID=1080227 RepID=A0A1C3EML8_9GAMM|nr:methyltransferase domain-containing protein [Veronia pacifica]ODA34493.1 hypothetical protein A8L45_05850 [Veronia pacifica]